MAGLSVLLAAACGVLAARDTVAAPAHDTLAARDTAAVRVAAAAHFAVRERAVARAVTIRADTAWATVRHGSITLTVVRLRREAGGWRFEREVAYGIH